MGITNRKRGRSGTTCVARGTDGKVADVSWLKRGG